MCTWLVWCDVVCGVQVRVLCPWAVRCMLRAPWVRCACSGVCGVSEAGVGLFLKLHLTSHRMSRSAEPFRQAF